MSHDPKQLHVLINSVLVGVVSQDDRGQLSFRYDRDWPERGRGLLLSLSMPFDRALHKHQVISTYMRGLLPDNEQILQRLGNRYHVPSNPFALLAHMGEDCPGAVQLIAPQRIEEMQGHEGVDWIDENEVANRLKAVGNDASMTRMTGDPGQFSLGGMQPKIALYYDNDRWGIPYGRTPTTHILKPPRPDLKGHVENEHFCLILANRLGDLPIVKSQVKYFGEEVAIVVERYDRMKSKDHWQRIHQEDLCQALVIPPDKKYENDGGPGIKAIMEILQRSSNPQTDRRRFMRAIIYNYLIAGTDAHAKNYSVLLAPQRQLRLAPLYDIASYLPYVQNDFQKQKLAMRVGKKYKLQDIRPRQWEDEARWCNFLPEEALDMIKEMITQLPDLASDTVRSCYNDGIKHTVIGQLGNAIAERCKQLKNLY